MDNQNAPQSMQQPKSNNLQSGVDPNKPIEFEFSRNLENWLIQNNCSILCTSYKRNVIFSFGQWQNQIQAHYTTSYARPMELFYKDNFVYLGSRIAITSFVNRYEKSNKDSETGVIFDGNFIPKTLNIVGDIDIHDILVTKNNDVLFVSSLLNSVCRLTNQNDEKSFEIVWTPKFISRVVEEDRCHLNSFCLISNKVKYATAIADTDTVDGWRDNRVDGGVIIDAETDEIVCSKLCMPHSLNFYNNKLYVLESGRGLFGFIDFDEQDITKRFKSICFIPGYLRSLKFINNYAVIGVSMDRHERCFDGLPLKDELEKRKIKARCGVAIVDITTGTVKHFIRLNNVVETYGVEVVPNVRTVRLMDINDPSVVDGFTY